VNLAWKLALAGAGGLGLGAAAWWLVTQPVHRLVAPPEVRDARIDPAGLEAHVRGLVAIGPRSQDTPEGMARAADWVASELAAAGARVTRQAFTVDGHEYRNVPGFLGPGTGPRLVVGAHYDTAFGNPGADDNASGVAGVLALARLLRGVDLRHSVELVAWALEELPAFRTPNQGSAVHARALRAGSVPVSGVICLEMIGYFTDAPRSQGYPVNALRACYPGRGNFIAVVSSTGNVALVRRVKAAMAGASDLPVYSLNGPALLPGVDFSDHRSYWAEGYPAVMVTDTAFFRNARYHTPRDLPETLDYTRMAEVVRGVLAAVLAIDRT
jgi:hypothetical protein